MKTELSLPSPLQDITDLLQPKNRSLKILVKRDDLIHHEISGNKWRKLHYNFENFFQGKYESLLTFGGAFSNHIAATASAGKLFNIPTIGIIRGNELRDDSNETLKKASENGMKLHFVSRDEYDLKTEKYYLEQLRIDFGNCLIIPEGGSNYLGVQGIGEIIHELQDEPDYIITACGTGTTAAGLLLATEKSIIIGIPVLKSGHFLKESIASLIYQSIFDENTEPYLERLDLKTEFHFGGYGKFTSELIDFMSNWKNQTLIETDQVYTGKMFYAFNALMNSDFFKPNSTIVLLHTGGLQGKLKWVWIQLSVIIS